MNISHKEHEVTKITKRRSEVFVRRLYVNFTIR